MLYIERQEIEKKGLRPLPPRSIQHILLFTSFDQISRIYYDRFDENRPFDIAPATREWLWYNSDRETSEWPGWPTLTFKRTEDRTWSYDLWIHSQYDPKKPFNPWCGTYIGFKDKAVAMHFKLEFS